MPRTPANDPQRDISPCFRFWRHGFFDEQLAGRAAIPSVDDAGIVRDYFTGAPVRPREP